MSRGQTFGHVRTRHDPGVRPADLSARKGAAFPANRARQVTCPWTCPASNRSTRGQTRGRVPRGRGLEAGAARCGERALRQARAWGAGVVVTRRDVVRAVGIEERRERLNL